MSTVLYTVTSQETLFDGCCDQEDLRFDADCWYKGDDREKSIDLARRYSDDVIEVRKRGISRDVYQWSALEIEDDVVIGCEIEIFDPLDRFKRTKELAKCAHACNRDLISYIVGKRELIVNGVFRYNDNWIDMYRYEDTAFGDFTAYEDNGCLWLPEGFNDYAIMNPDVLLLAMAEGVTFWTDYQIDDPEMKLMYRIFKNRSL